MHPCEVCIEAILRDEVIEVLRLQPKMMENEALFHILDLRENPRPYASYPAVVETFRVVYVFNFRLFYFTDDQQQTITVLSFRAWEL